MQRALLSSTGGEHALFEPEGPCTRNNPDPFYLIAARKWPRGRSSPRSSSLQKISLGQV